ncbi:MAG: helix-turn-helix transcriptional regulator [Mycobacterium sp.]|nr:helix-turn-helix transcriptional regulator [Mycobacterium sp.]
MGQWDAETHVRVASAIKSARGNRSAQWLADTTMALGYPISRAQIANYESGRKKTLDIAELIILAAALGVPPVALLYPELPDGEVEVLPGWTATSWDALTWFTGTVVSSHTNSRVAWGLSEGAQLVDAVRKRRDLMLRLPALQARAEATSADDRVLREAALLEVSTVRDEIHRLSAVIQTVGGVLNNAPTEDGSGGAWSAQ